MGKDVLYLVDLNRVELSENDGSPTSSWIHALPVGTYQHPVFGTMQMTAEKIRAFAENVKVKIRGIDPSINYLHGTTAGGDGEAAGWVKDAENRADGLWVLVEWTATAAQKIKEKAFRYFSAEYQDKWTDAQGKTHDNVFFGGALTNRPYMKNLLPINLSETSVESFVEFSEILAKGKEQLAKETPKEGEDVDLKKLNEALGLPPETTESELIAKLSQLGATQNPTEKKTPEVPAVKLSEELRKLSDENPMVKALIETVDAQNKALNEFKVSLREQDVDRRLAEFDKSRIVLTAKAKDLVHDLALDLPIELSDRFWELLETMRNSSSLMVELGERAGTSVRYGRAKAPQDMFMDESNKLAQERKISLSEAMEQVARDNPKLYSEYRSATYSFQE